MKRILIFLSFLSFVLSLSAQKIIADDEQNGCRRITTSQKSIYERMVSYGAKLGLTMIINQKDTSYVINMLFYSENERSTTTEGRLLAKLKDGSVFEFTNTTDPSLKKKDEGSIIYPIGGMGFVIPSETYTSYASYPVSKEQLEKMIEVGVSKIRVESTVGYKDRKIWNNKFSNVLRKDLKVLKEASTKSSQLYEGF